MAEFKAVREAVNRNGVAFQFGTEARSIFYYRHAVELVRNKRIGELKTIMIGWLWVPASNSMGSRRTRRRASITTCGLARPPWAPYSDLRVSIAAWLYISDYGLGHLDGAWGIHEIDIAQWANDSDTTGPIDVEGTGSFYTDIRDMPYEWTVEHTYANGVRLIHMDMVTARKRVPQFNLIQNNGATVISGRKAGFTPAGRESLRIPRRWPTKESARTRSR